MSDMYEVVVSLPGRKLFEEVFLRYMDRVGFVRLGVGGRLGRPSAHEFRSDLGVVSLGVSPEGQSRFRLVVRSETILVQPLVLDALTEGLADFMESFCDGLSSPTDSGAIRKLIQGLRDSFPENVREIETIS